MVRSSDGIRTDNFGTFDSSGNLKQDNFITLNGISSLSANQNGNSIPSSNTISNTISIIQKVSQQISSAITPNQQSPESNITLFFSRFFFNSFFTIISNPIYQL